MDRLLQSSAADALGQAPRAVELQGRPVLVVEPPTTAHVDELRGPRERARAAIDGRIVRVPVEPHGRMIRVPEPDDPRAGIHHVHAHFVVVIPIRTEGRRVLGGADGESPLASVGAHELERRPRHLHPKIRQLVTSAARGERELRASGPIGVLDPAVECSAEQIRRRIAQVLIRRQCADAPASRPAAAVRRVAIALFTIVAAVAAARRLSAEVGHHHGHRP